MWADPIVEEIHAVRRQLASECQDDLKKIVQRAVQRQSLRLANQQLPVHKFDTAMGTKAKGILGQYPL